MTTGTDLGLRTLQDDLAHLAELLSKADGLGEHFTCGEAEALTRVLAHANPAQAASFLLGHCLGDEEIEDDDPTHLAIKAREEAHMASLRAAQRCTVDGCTVRPDRTIPGQGLRCQVHGADWRPTH